MQQPAQRERGRTTPETKEAGRGTINISSGLKRVPSWSRCGLASPCLRFPVTRCAAKSRSPGGARVAQGGAGRDGCPGGAGCDTSQGSLCLPPTPRHGNKDVGSQVGAPLTLPGTGKEGAEAVRSYHFRGPALCRVLCTVLPVGHTQGDRPGLGCRHAGSRWAVKHPDS